MAMGSLLFILNHVVNLKSFHRSEISVVFAFSEHISLSQRRYLLTSSANLMDGAKKARVSEILCITESPDF